MDRNLTCNGEEDRVCTKRFLFHGDIRNRDWEILYHQLHIVPSHRCSSFVPQSAGLLSKRERTCERANTGVQVVKATQS